MSRRVLHLVDATTSGDALEILAQLCAQRPGEHRVACLGHRRIERLAQRAGISPPDARDAGILWARSLGWPDPSGWREVRRLVRALQPTHLHAWGISGAVAATTVKFSGPRTATFANWPLARHLRVLRWAGRRSAFNWIVTSATLRDQFAAAGLEASRLTVIPPGTSPNHDADKARGKALRSQLGIAPEDGPVLLLGGEGRRARPDHGIWAAAIVQQILPRTRIILRQDPRDGSIPGLDRFFNLLPDDRLIAIAPARLSWDQLLRAADLLLIAADATIPTGSILRAMHAGVPVIATPIPAVMELIQHGRNGIVAQAPRPRFLAARAHEFLAAPELKAPMVATAQADVREKFKLTAMLAAYEALE